MTELVNLSEWGLGWHGQPGHWLKLDVRLCVGAGPGHMLSAPWQLAAAPPHRRDHVNCPQKTTLVESSDWDMD